MSTFAVKPLVNGFLPTPQAAIFTAAAVTYLKKLFLYNTNASTQTIQLYLTPAGGAAMPFRQLALALNESADVLEDGDSITFAVGDALEAVTTTASAASFALAGVNET